MSRRKRPPPVALDPTAIPVKLARAHVRAIDLAAARQRSLRSEWMRDRLAEGLGIEPGRLHALVAARALLAAVRGEERPEGRALTVTVRMRTPADVDAVGAAAEACDMGRSEWCRAVLLAHAQPAEHRNAMMLVQYAAQCVD